jgi:hypothetical protein
MISARWLLLAAALALPAQPAVEKRAIQLARSARVSALERGLPRQRLDHWLATLLGPAIQWEVNDCGEQSGNPAVDRARDMPMCVDAIAKLDGSRIAIVTLMMGTYGKGLSKTPVLRAVNLGQDSKYYAVPTLAALARSLSRIP